MITWQNMAGNKLITDPEDDEDEDEEQEEGDTMPWNK